MNRNLQEKNKWFSVFETVAEANKIETDINRVIYFFLLKPTITVNFFVNLFIFIRKILVNLSRDFYRKNYFNIVSLARPSLADSTVNIIASNLSFLIRKSVYFL